MRTPVSDHELHAYVDNQLSDSDRARVESWIAEHPEDRQRLQEYQRINRELLDAFHSTLTEPVPHHLHLAAGGSANRGKRWLHAAALAACTVLGAGGGWWFRGAPTPAEPAAVANLQQYLVRPALVSHRVYTPEVLHPVEVQRDQEQHLAKWLSKRLGAQISAPALDTLGYGLIGGRLLPSDSGPAAQFMYENDAGQRMTLYVKRRDKERDQTGFGYQQNEQLASFYWIEGALGYALTAPIPKQQLFPIAQSVYHQLSF